MLHSQPVIDSRIHDNQSYIVYILYLNFFRNIDVRGWSSTIVVILFLGGIQLLMIGALWEYIARIYDEVRSRPNYIISYTKNIDANE